MDPTLNDFIKQHFLDEANEQTASPGLAAEQPVQQEQSAYHFCSLDPGVPSTPTPPSPPRSPSPTPRRMVPKALVIVVAGRG